MGNSNAFQGFKLFVRRAGGVQRWLSLQLNSRQIVRGASWCAIRTQTSDDSVQFLIITRAWAIGLYLSCILMAGGDKNEPVSAHDQVNDISGRFGAYLMAKASSPSASARMKKGER